MFPDKASLYICAIEDRQYKEEKIFCKFLIIQSTVCVKPETQFIVSFCMKGNWNYFSSFSFIFWSLHNKLGSADTQDVFFLMEILVKNYTAEF